MLLRFSQFSPLYPPLSHTPYPPAFLPHLVHVHALYIYVLCVLCFLYHFYPSHLVYAYIYTSFSLYTCPPIPPVPLPAEIPPRDVHFSDSVPVLVVCLVLVFLFFPFLFGSVVDSCEFVDISLFIVLVFFNLLDKSL